MLAAVGVSRYAPAFQSGIAARMGSHVSSPARQKKILLSGRMPHDWEPFAPVALHYPLGSHYLIAAISSFSRVPLHLWFSIG